MLRGSAAGAIAGLGALVTAPAHAQPASPDRDKSIGTLTADPIVGVRTGVHPSYERLVLDFAGSSPGGAWIGYSQASGQWARGRLTKVGVSRSNQSVAVGGDVGQIGVAEEAAHDVGQGLQAWQRGDGQGFELVGTGDAGAADAVVFDVSRRVRLPSATHQVPGDQELVSGSPPLPHALHADLLQLDQPG